MIRLAISVEGPTEREFVNAVLRPHLARSGLTITAVDLRGNISLDRVKGALPALMGGFDYVSTLYDFYGFKGRDGRSVTELEAALLQLVDAGQQRRFMPYVQMYEFEALLFAAPQQTVEWLAGTHSQMQQMQEAVRRSGSPELVNDSPQTSPSHRIKDYFPGYDKKLHGPEILELAGLALIRSQCPRFDKWLSTLENLKS